MPGLKGDPGEPISLPEVIISPNTQTVSENQTARFYCSASGNPTPTVIWSKVNGSLTEGNARSHKNSGKLEVIHANFNDSGDFMCTAVNILGKHEEIAKLVVEGMCVIYTIWLFYSFTDLFVYLFIYLFISELYLQMLFGVS